MQFIDFVAKERAFHTSKHALISLVSHLGVIALTTAFLWGDFESVHLSTWAVCSGLVALCGWFYNHDAQRQYNRRNHPVAKHGRTAESTAVGLMWGLIPVFFFNAESTEYIVLMIALYCGYVSGALGVSYSNAASFWGFSLGISVPFAARMFYQGGELYTLIGALIIFYVLALAYVANNMQSLFKESSRSKYENLQLLDELANEKEVAERAVISKNRFLASASHDLRQPLNAVTLFVDALLPIQTSELGQEIIAKIKLSMSSLNGMLHSLLDISKLDAEAIELKPEPLDLTQTVEQLLHEYRETKAGKLILTSDIPPSTIVVADQTVMYRLIRNLLDNAVKYTNQGNVSVSCSCDQSVATLRISDTGIGIPEHELDRVFEEFEQLNNIERSREKGLGLGLSIVKRLCELAQIPLAIESQLDVGTTVTLKFPLSTQALLGNTEHAEELELRSALVVLIDDEAEVLDSIKHILQQWGCRVLAAQSLTEVRPQLAILDSPPDLLISDFRLGDNQQGSDVIDAIREEFNRDIPAILITGDTAPERISAANQEGLRVLYKPFDAKALKAAVFDVWVTVNR